MAGSSRYVIVHALINQSIRRQYELPVEADGVDQQAFHRWLLDVLPSVSERSGGQRVELWKEDW